MLGRLTQQAQTTGAVTHMDLSEGVPEGLVKTNAGGHTYTGDGRKIATQTPQGVVYSASRDIEYKLITYYDSNSPEDEPVMYIYKKADQAQNDELLKIEVNKINPSNASYEEMLAIAGYTYRDDPKAARDAADAIDMARDYMELDGFDAQTGFYDYTSCLYEVIRRNKDNSNPANRILAESAKNLLEYLKDYPRGSDN